MERILIKDLGGHVGKEVTISGWVDVRRDHGKLIFIDLRDRTGTVQTVANKPETHDLVDPIRAEWVVSLTGTVNKRPENMIKSDVLNGDIELAITSVEVLSKAHELPFELDAELNQDTYLDHLPLTLRSSRARDIFRVQATIMEAFRESMQRQGFLEYQNPVLAGGDAEGGAAAFKVAYHNEREALLATSPQLYKQMMTGVFERVFTNTKVFRAEKHATPRHLSEAMQLDFEMGFITDHHDVLHVLRELMADVVKAVSTKHADVFERLDVPAPLVPKRIPVLKLREAQTVLQNELDTKCDGEPDLEPEHERKLSEWALKKYDSDCIFVTHFPDEKRPFYTYSDPDDPGYGRSFDLLFRGLEINSGSQRVHDYDQLVGRMKDRDLDPDTFSFYLETFRYGIPPHGGCSTGLERLTARMLLLDNVREATLFPRDINRIDTLLSQ